MRHLQGLNVIKGGCEEPLQLGLAAQHIKRLLRPRASSKVPLVDALDVKGSRLQGSWRRDPRDTSGSFCSVQGNLVGQEWKRIL